MRYIPFQIDVFDAARNAELAREREFQAMHRRPDAPPLPAEPNLGAAVCSVAVYGGSCRSGFSRNAWRHGSEQK